MNQSPKHILVVDDEAIIRHTLATLLRRQGYTVWTAADSVEAAVLLRDEAFDLLVLDLYLPGGVSGLDIARSARVSQPNAIVVILTGSDVLANMVSDSSMPQCEIMFKTASPTDVLDRVAALLNQQPEGDTITQQGSFNGLVFQV